MDLQLSDSLLLTVPLVLELELMFIIQVLV